VPIGHITNGVHVNTWLAPQMRLVYDRHLGARWAERTSEHLWEAIDAIDDGELWEAHQTLKAQLIHFRSHRSMLILPTSFTVAEGSRKFSRSAARPSARSAGRQSAG
jgi:glucan phosphorylase